MRLAVLDECPIARIWGEKFAMRYERRESEFFLYSWVRSYISLGRKRLLALFATLAIALLSGCATIITGSTQEMSFQSSLDEATVTIGDRIIGKTPITVRLGNKTGQSVTFTKDGYEPLTMQLSTELQPWFFGNVIIGGLLGSTTNGASGAIHEYSPSQYMVTLQPLKLSSAERVTSQSDHEKIGQFVVVSYRDLVRDIRSGKGDYLTSLLTMKRVEKEKEAEALQKLRALSDLYSDDISRFADQAANLGV